ncbi:sulfotransferase family protein [Glycomyces harbinensis]|uniref:sulfotransferase family protein n=1 Tax=Glycomyces harbinensis TaxID=58114 RepID=UPI00115FC96C|nr:sulfotransferase [Glycomyces harbinensis]
MAYATPTLTLRALNNLLAPLTIGLERRADATMDRIVARAERETGESPEGHAQLIEDFRLILRAWARQDGASTIGWKSVVDQVQGRVINRFRIARAIAEHPEIEDEPIDDPIVVTGLPRTATTLAHNLLSNPEGNRAPLLWEMLQTPPPGTDEAGLRARIKSTERYVANFEKAVPALPNIHKMGAMLPEECVFIMSFHTFMWTLTGHMPELREWFAKRDYTEDYRYLKRTLQVLQHGQERKRWVLKSPCHLWSLPALIKTFPDARVIWTHRDPITVMASYCSLAEGTWSVYLRKFDRSSLGRMCLDVLTEGIEAARAARTMIPARNLLDVGYSHLAGDAMVQVPRLFHHLGLEWDEREFQHLEYRMSRPDQSRRHEYSLGSYGLTPFEVEAAFGDYVRRVETLPAIPDTVLPAPPFTVEWQTLRGARRR